MKKSIPEILFWFVVLLTVIGLFTNIAMVLKDGTDVYFTPDGEAVNTVTIDGHQYLKSVSVLTHSESCTNAVHKGNQ